jgi:hypothetical protein
VHSLPVKLKNPARYFMGGIFCFSVFYRAFLSVTVLSCFSNTL